MNKQRVLDQIKADILHQNICPDLAKQANQLVFGTGSVDANVVFIGEAPGKNEDLKGEPFVGASGKFLDEMLDSIGLSRTNIYITNIVKYRPPKNRDPSREEKEAFIPFLYAQLAAIAPKVVVTLGRHSTSCFLPGLQISAIHGQTHDITVKIENKQYNWTILPLYHPAAAIYNQKLRQTLRDDFKTIKQITK
ncbi:MAG: uracil-DNA glycosylase [Candidatus Saccharibacteria bacterium]